MLNSYHLRLAVFDCDGTLVDSQHSILSALKAAFTATGTTDIDEDEARRVIGMPLAEAIARLLPDSAPDVVASVIRAYKDAYFDMRADDDAEEPLYPGVIDSLEALTDAGFILGIATGKSKRGLMSTLAAHGLADRFAVTLSADDGPGKPNPEILYRAMDLCGVEPAHTVMIGDTTFDISMARRARVGAIGVSWGYHSTEALKTAGAHAICRRYRDLPLIMEGLLQAA